MYHSQSENNIFKLNRMKNRNSNLGKILKAVFEVMTYVSLLIDFLKWYGYFTPLF